MMKLLELIQRPLSFKGNGRVEEISQVQLLDSVDSLEELVRSQPGVKEARISFKTSAGGKRFLQIRVLPTKGKLRGEPFQKLAGRLSTVVAPRVDVPKGSIQIRMLKARNVS